MKHLNLLAGILGAILLISVSTIVGKDFRLNKNTDFRKTSVKVYGDYGHGSGNIIDTTASESLILTNKHVCKGIAKLDELKQSLEILQYMMFNNPECSTFQCITKNDRNNGPLLFKIFINIAGVNSKTFQKHFEKNPTNPDHLVTVLKSEISRAIQIKFMNLDLPDSPTKIHAISDNTDLCILKIPVGNLPIIKIAGKRPKVGDKVQTIGNPHQAENHFVEGFVGNDKRVWGNMYTLITAPIYPGQSGSVTVNMLGELVGVNTLSDLRAATIGYMIPLEDVLMFLDGKMLVRKINMQI